MEFQLQVQHRESNDCITIQRSYSFQSRRVCQHIWRAVRTLPGHKDEVAGVVPDFRAAFLWEREHLKEV